jgi:KRAB domain-containing zinc finger protein
MNKRSFRKILTFFSGKPDLLRQHISITRHSPNLYHCLACGHGFEKFIALLEHFKQYHDEQNNKKITPCFLCKKVFLHRTTMLAHKCDPAQLTPEKKKEKTKKPLKRLPNAKKKTQKVGGGEKTVSLHKCTRCGETFLDDDELMCHQHSVCLEKPKFVCTNCGREFSTAYRLNSHKMVHNERQFVCDVCGICFISKVGKMYLNF